VIGHSSSSNISKFLNLVKTLMSSIESILLFANLISLIDSYSGKFLNSDPVILLSHNSN
jgi:hypothetical protein